MRLINACLLLMVISSFGLSAALQDFARTRAQLCRAARCIEEPQLQTGSSRPAVPDRGGGGGEEVDTRAPLAQGAGRNYREESGNSRIPRIVLGPRHGLPGAEWRYPGC